MNPVSLPKNYYPPIIPARKFSHLLNNQAFLCGLRYNFSITPIYQIISRDQKLKSNVINQELFDGNWTHQIKSIIQQNIPERNVLDTVYNQKTQQDKQEQKKQQQQVISCLKHITYQANVTIEDKISYCSIKTLNAVMVSVFDGHGGFQLSKYCSENINSLVNRYVVQNLEAYQSDYIQLISKALQLAYQQLQNSFFQIYKNQIKRGNRKLRGVGSCAITAVIFKGHVIVANSGDSQAMIISQNQSNFSYKKLSERYSVNNQSQRVRLIKQFGKTDPDYYLKHEQFFTLDGQFNGPYLNCNPAISIHKIKAGDQTLIIASDGLWDYLSKWQILKTVVQCKKINQKRNNSQLQTESDAESNYKYDDNSVCPLQRLVDKILQKSADECQTSIQFLKKINSGQRRNYHDDISICLVDLSQFLQNELFQ